MEERLDGVRLGCWRRVTQIQGEETLVRRLGDFGLLPGTLVRPEYRSPGNHGTVITFRGTQLALRTKDLGKIRVML